MKRTSIFVGMICTAALIVPLSVTSQEEDAPPGALFDVWMVVPKADMQAEFTAAAAAHAKFRAEAGESRLWQAFRVVLGDSLNVVQYRTCCHEWADFDSFDAEDVEKGLGENWSENVGQYVDHYHHYIESADWENSYWPDEGVDGPYYGVTTWTIKQGSGPASGQARVKLSELAKEHGWARDGIEWLWLSREAGKPVTMLVSSYANFSEMAPQEQSFFELLSEKMGAEEAGAVFAEFGAGFSDSDYTVWELDEDLSTPVSED